MNATWFIEVYLGREEWQEAASAGSLQAGIERRTTTHIIDSGEEDR